LNTSLELVASSIHLQSINVWLCIAAMLLLGYLCMVLVVGGTAAYTSFLDMTMVICCCDACLPALPLVRQMYSQHTCGF
jgi:hypothetical protein